MILLKMTSAEMQKQKHKKLFSIYIILEMAEDSQLDMSGGIIWVGDLGILVKFCNSGHRMGTPQSVIKHSP